MRDLVCPSSFSSLPPPEEGLSSLTARMRTAGHGGGSCWRQGCRADILSWWMLILSSCPGSAEPCADACTEQSTCTGDSRGAAMASWLSEGED